jgi:hypothetical protein
MIQGSSCQGSNDHDDHTYQKHDDGDLVDPVHHAQVKRIGRIGVFFFENPDEVIKYITQ